MERVGGGPSQSFWTNLEEQGASKFGQNGPKMRNNGDLKVLVVQNGWNSMEELLLGPPATRSTLIPRCSNRSEPSEPLNCHFYAFLGHFCLFERPWTKIGGSQLLQVGPKTLTWTSPNPFHLRSILFQLFRTTRTFKLPCLGNFGQFGPFLGTPGPNLGAPRSSKLVQKL